MTSMATYRAAVVQEGNYWVITAEAGGLHLGGQVDRLEDAAGVIQSIIATALEVPDDSVSVELDER